MSAVPVAALPVSYDMYIRHGWALVPIAPGSKGPKTPGWNKRENVLTSSAVLPQGYGVGLAHAYSGTMALDVDDWVQAQALLADHGIDLNALYNASDAVTINSGVSGHGKLIYQMPFGLTLPSKKIMADKKVAYELRCASASGLTVQDVIPPTIHPVTNRPYEWGSRGNWQKLPTIPMELLALWQTILDADKERTVTVSGTIDASWDEIKSALYAISPDCDRQQWIDCGMALHDAGTSTDQLDHAYTLWDEWSQQSQAKYKASDMPVQWRSFKPTEAGIKLGTLFHHATNAGWKRPMPDAAHLFSTVTPTAPKSITDSMVVPIPECDLDHLPKVLVKRAKVIQKELGADPLVAVMAGLGAVCAAADARIRLTLMASWKVPPVLWLMTIGTPAAKKTPAARPMLEILKALEKEDIPRYAKELQNFEGLDSAYASSKKAYLTAAQDPNNILTGKLDITSLPPVIEKPAKPVQLRMTVSDVTSQKLVRLAAERPRGLLCHLDEMRSWSDKLADKMSGEDRSCWTTSYECDTYTMDRVGDGKTDNNIRADNFAVAIFGNMQPRVFKEKLTALSNDGLIQRFIFAIIRDGYSDIKNDPDAADPQSAAEYESIIRKIYSLSETEYNLSPEAFHAFRSFQDWYIRLKQDERLLHAAPIYTEAIGKLEGTCGRLALIFHLLNDAFNPFVSEETMLQAINFTKSYLVPAMRHAYGEVAGIDNGSLDHWVMQHIIHLSSEVNTVSLSELRRSARRQIEQHSPQRADMLLLDSMALLEYHGWIARTVDTVKSVQWAINPSVAEQNKEFRLEVIKAKQRRYDEIHRISGGKAPRRIASGYDPTTMDE